MGDDICNDRDCPPYYFSVHHLFLCRSVDCRELKESAIRYEIRASIVQLYLVVQTNAQSTSDGRAFARAGNRSTHGSNRRSYAKRLI